MADNVELKLQLHYLYKHLLRMGRNKKDPFERSSLKDKEYSGTNTTDLDLLIGSTKFSFLRDHIITQIQLTLKQTPPERQSPHMISLLKKLLPRQDDVPEALTNLKPDFELILRSMDKTTPKTPVDTLHKVRSAETLLEKHKGTADKRRNSPIKEESGQGDKGAGGPKPPSISSITKQNDE